MNTRREYLRIGGGALLVTLAGCASNEASSEPTETESPLETTTNDRTTTSPTDQPTEETTPTENTLDLGFPVTDLTAEVVKWDEVGDGYGRARVITSNAVYADGSGNVGKIPHGESEIVWEIARNGSAVVPYRNGTYVATDAGVYDGSSGEQLFSTDSQFYSPEFVSDGVWYFGNDGLARKYNFNGEAGRTVFTTNYANYSGGTVDEDQGVIYVASQGGLFGIDIDESDAKKSTTRVEIGSGSDIDMVSSDLDGGEFELAGEIGAYVTGGTAVTFDSTSYSKQSQFAVNSKARHTTAADGKLVTRNSAFEGPFECFNLQTGEKLWSTGPLSLARASQRKPVVFNGYLIVKLENHQLGVYDLDSGDRVTTVDLTEIGGNSLGGRMDKLFVDADQLCISNISGFMRITGETDMSIED